MAGSNCVSCVSEVEDQCIHHRFPGMEAGQTFSCMLLSYMLLGVSGASMLMMDQQQICFCWNVLGKAVRINK